MAIPTELQPDVMLGVFEKYNTVAGRLAKYFPPLPNPKAGNSVNYEVVDMGRRHAPIVARGDRAPARPAPTRTRVSYEGVTVKGQLPLDPEIQKDMLNPGSMDEVSREKHVSLAIRALRLDFERTWEFLRAQWMTGGALVASDGSVPGGGDGTIYMPFEGVATDSPLSISMGMLATHIDATVAVSWATSTTNVLGDLEAASALLSADGSVVADTVILNSTTMKYLRGNDDVVASNDAKGELFRKGKLEDFWGFHFDIIDDVFPITTDMFNDTAGTQKLIPNNVVIVTSSNNDACGRGMLECEAVDTRAGAGQRGLFSWTDEDGEHPHAISPGSEWTGGPIWENVDGLYVFTDVTAT